MLVSLCEAGFQRVFSPHSPTALPLLRSCCGAGTWLCGFFAREICLPPPLKGMGFTNWAETFSGLPTLWIQERSLCSNTALTTPGKTEGWSQEPAGFGQCSTRLGTTAGHLTSIADSSALQQNMTHLLSADISYYGIGILSMINLSCQSFSMKLTL